MLTIKKLKEMKPGIFAKGKVVDNEIGINMIRSESESLLKWVAVRGGIHDWAIYCQHYYRGYEYVKDYGDKVRGEENIKKLVPCDDESFALYRY